MVGGWGELVGREGGPKQESKLFILFLDAWSILHWANVVFKYGLLILVKIFEQNILYLVIIGLILVLWQGEEESLDGETVDVTMIEILLARLVEVQMEVLMPAAIHNNF